MANQKCEECGKRFVLGETGRPQKFCSRRCNNKASYARWILKNRRVTIPRDTTRKSA